MARCLVVGAGAGGLAAAIRLAAAGHDVLVLERAAAAGGKIHARAPGGRDLDAGPTVLTLRDVFTELWEAAGARLEDDVALRPLEVLARHAWPDGARLDLHADPARTEEAIAHAFGRAEAHGFRDFLHRARAAFLALDRPFMRAADPSPLSVARAPLDPASGGWGPHVAGLWNAAPFGTLWEALGRHFRDARLRQLFARYATYCGASPFQAPGTLMLVAHVEQRGVWTVEGGMRRLAAAMAALATRSGARFRFGAEAASLLLEGGRCAGLRLADGEVLRADAVIFNGDAAALRDGMLGPEARDALPPAASPRSLSALTWCGEFRAAGFPLARHTVFFGGDYAEEFDALFHRSGLPREPTTYVHAEDRAEGAAPPAGAERLLVLVNAPPTPLRPEETETCRRASFDLLRRCGLHLTPVAVEETAPQDWARRFPATAGALYGAAPHGWRASFARPRAATRLPGLFLAGGSAHPGAGVPMAVLSGAMAAAAFSHHCRGLTSRLAMATPGGTSMR